MRAARGKSPAPGSGYPVFLVSVLVLLAGWEAVDRAGWISPVLFSSPSRIVSSGVDLLGSGKINDDLVTTLAGFSAAFLVATFFGVIAGIAIGYSETLYRIFHPYIVAVNAVPKIVLMPLVILWFGLGLPSKVFLGGVMAGFPIVVSTHAGVRGLDREYIQLARAFRASRRRILRSVILPSIAPYVLSGMRVGINYAMVGVLIVEFFASGKGVGYRMVLYTQNFQIDRFFVLLVVVVAFTLVCTELVQRLERRMGSWRPSAF